VSGLVVPICPQVTEGRKVAVVGAPAGWPCAASYAADGAAAT